MSTGNGYPQKSWSKMMQYAEYFVPAIPIVSGGIGLVGLQSSGKLDWESNEHQAILTLSIALCIVYVSKIIIEYKYEPGSWLCFGTYCLIAIGLSAIQLYFTDKASYSDSTKFGKPSSLLLILSMCFCGLQFVLGVCYIVEITKKLPDLSLSIRPNNSLLTN
eukprot:UN02468